MSDLVSKVLAGGLSAGIFLLWWPAHVPATGAEWLIVRGVLWTLAFEILLLSFCPLERAVATAVRDRRVRAIAPRSFARALALSVAGFAIPVALFGGADANLGAPVQAAAAAPKVIVKREIVRREVVVRRVNHVVRVPVAAPAPTRTAVVAPAPARAPHTAAKATASAKPKATTTSDAVASAPEGSTSTPSAAAPTATAPSTGRPAPAATPAATAPGTAGVSAPAATATPAPAPGN